MKVLSILAAAAFALSVGIVGAQANDATGCQGFTVHGIWDCR